MTLLNAKELNADAKIYFDAKTYLIPVDADVRTSGIDTLKKTSEYSLENNVNIILVVKKIKITDSTPVRIIFNNFLKYEGQLGLQNPTERIKKN